MYTILIFMFTGLANIFLQIMSRNIMFGYFGLLCVIICTLATFRRSSTILKKTTLIFSYAGFVFSIYYNIYCHIIYNSLSYDHLIIIVESVMCLMILILNPFTDSDTENNN